MMKSDPAFNGKIVLKEGGAEVEMGCKAGFRRNQMNSMRSANWIEN